MSHLLETSTQYVPVIRGSTVQAGPWDHAEVKNCNATKAGPKK